MEESSPVRRAAGRPVVTPARQAALRVLSDLRLGWSTAGRRAEDLLDACDLPGRDRALATELVLGVLRHRLTLEAILGQLAVRGWKGVSDQLRDVLMLGAYQLLWLDGVPAYAAVAEAVEQARAEGGARASRFVNAILRQLGRDIEIHRIASHRADPARSIPIDARRSCQFRRPFLPDPATVPLDHLSASTSHPIWLVRRWVEAFGLDEARSVCLAGLCRPSLALRPNRCRIDARTLSGRLVAEGIECTIIPGEEVLWVPSGSRPTHTEAFREGYFQPQDRTAMRAVEAMRPRPGQAIVDLCAGPGTKSTQLAEIMDDRGTVLASDKDDSRLAPVRENCQRLGLTIVRTVLPEDLEQAAAGLERVDWILVDAPCSNTGVLARRPEARYRLNEIALRSLASLQLTLLGRAATLARPHTRLMYSTCSIEIEENEAVVSEFLRLHPGWRLAAQHRELPSAGNAPEQWRDGGYWAILQS